MRSRKNNLYLRCVIPLVLGFVLFGLSGMKGQCPVPVISGPDTVCMGTSVNLYNISTDTADWEWDFCVDDLEHTVFDTLLGNPGNLIKYPIMVKMIRDSGLCYAFVSNYQDDKIIRFDFGNSFMNPPTSTALTVTGTLNAPAGLQFVRDKGTWYALVANAGSNTIGRIVFDQGLSDNTVTVTDLGNIGGSLNSPTGMALIKEQSNYYAFVVNYNSYTVTRIIFNDSITNPSPGAYTTPAISGVNRVLDIVIEKVCDQWVGFVDSYLTGNIIRITWQSTLGSAMTFTNLGNFGIGRMLELALVYDGGSYYIITADRNTKKAMKLDFGADPLNNTPVATLLGNPTSIGEPRAIESFQDSSHTYIIISDLSNNSLTRVNFSDVCEGNKVFVNDTNVGNLVYSTPGMKYFTITGSDSSGNTIHELDSIFVLDNPVASFTVSNRCYPAGVMFIDQSTTSDGVGSWTWDFGDAATDSVLAPLHQYADTGWYNVQLSIVTNYGCKDSSTMAVRINSNPFAQFSSSAACAGTPSVFSDSSTLSSGSLISWDWDFAGQGTDTLPDPTFIFDTAGTFLTTLIVASDSGCYDTSMQSIIVPDKPYTAFVTDQTCSGDSTLLADSTWFAGSIVSWQWYFGDGDSAQSQNTGHVYADTGYFNTMLIVTGNNGCKDTLIQPVTLSDPAAVSFTYLPGQVCQDLPVSFLDQSVIGADSITAWFWQFGPADTSQLQYPTYAFQDTGNIVVVLDVMTGTSCKRSFYDTVHVYPVPRTGFTFSGVCLGSPTIFTDTSQTDAGSIVSWSWSFGDSQSDSIATPQHIYSDTLSYPVSLIVTTDVGCINNAFDTVRINPQPNAGFYSLLSCENLETQFSDTSVTGSDPLTVWAWSFGDSGTDTASNPAHIYTSSGNYLAELVVTTALGCKDTANAVISVGVSPDALYQFSDLCVGDTTVFTDLSSGSAVQWQWDFGDMSSASQQNPEHLYADTGTYAVLLTVYNAGFCWDTILQYIDIAPLPSVSFAIDTSCVGLSTTFTDSSSGADSLIAWDWVILGEPDTLHGWQTAYIFNQETQYFVTEYVTDAMGCTGMSSSLFTVHPTPTADFSFTPLYGETGMPITFNNNTVVDSIQIWYFGTGDSSTIPDPVYSYANDGTYTIQLISTNYYGCSDMAAKQITVVDAILDVSVDIVDAVLSGTYITITANVRNQGTRDVSELDMILTYPGLPSVLEHWNGILSIGTTMSYEFSARFEATDAQLPEYICVEADMPNGLSDDVPQNNRYCRAFLSSLMVFDPFPSPTVDIASLVLLSPEDGLLSFTVYDQVGKLVDQGTFQVTRGYNRLDMDMRKLDAGIYSIKMHLRSDEVLKRVLVGGER